MVADAGGRCDRNSLKAPPPLLDTHGMARRGWSWLVLTASFAALLLPVQAAGAIGEGLDRSFGRDGIYRRDFTEPSLDVANATASILGHPVLAGSAGGRFAVAVPEQPAFNGTWHPVLVDFGRPSAAFALSTVSESIFAAGNAGDDFAITVFDQTGNPNVAFGDNGRVRTSFGGPSVAYGVDAQAFTPLAVGTVQAGAGSSVAMVRLRADGSPDPSFGTGGKVTDDVTPGIDSANAVHVSAAVTIVGQAGPDVLVARYLADGRPDNSFGTAGRLVFSITPGDDVAHALQVGTTGEILVAGSAGGQAFLARVSPAGALLTGFGTGGVVRTALGGTAARFRGVVGLDGSRSTIVATGTVGGPSGDDAVIARFGMDGSPDPAFGTGGRTVVDLGGSLDQANALGIHGRDYLMMGGDGADMVVARIGETDGRLVASPAAPAVLRVDFGLPTTETANAIAVLPDGRTLIAASGTRGLVFERLLANGTRDTTFGTGGTVVTSLVVVPAAMVVVGEHILVLHHGRNAHGAVLRFTVAGALDHSYGYHGYALADSSFVGGAGVMAAMPDGRLVLGQGNRVVRLSATGQVEATFQTSGFSGQMVGIAVQPDGKIVTLHRGVTEVGATLKRFLADGSLDPSFFGAGWLTGSPVLADASALLLLRDGRLIVGARVTTLFTGPPEEPDLVLARFRADGWLDETFGSRGATRTPVQDLDRVVSLHEQSDGAIVSVFSPGLPYTGVGLARHFADGRTDTSVGLGGVSQFEATHVHAAAQAPDGDLLVAGTDGQDLLVAKAPLTDPDPAGSYHPVSPVRLLDTRTGLGSPASRLGPATTRALQVAGRGGVPLTGATSVVLNVTVTEPTQLSFLTAWPAGRSRPLASNLNFGSGVTVANMVVVKLGTDGRVNLYNDSGSAHVVADVAGWYGRGGATGRSGYSTLPPARILDTRTALGAPAARVGPGATLPMQVTGRGGVPATGVSAVVLNVTATDPTGGSYLTAWPDGTARPVASNLNWGPGQTVPNLVVVKVGTNGVVNLYNNQGSVHLVADVAGWYGSGAGGAMYSPLEPSRLYDSRNVATGGAKLGPESGVSLRVTGRAGVPTSGVTAVVLNVTVTEPTAISFLTVFPSISPMPLASNLNYAAGQTVPNLVVVKVSTDGAVSFYNNSGATHLVVDIAGWYAGP